MRFLNNLKKNVTATREVLNYIKRWVFSGKERERKWYIGKTWCGH
jgi:hypothetical protein